MTARIPHDDAQPSRRSFLAASGTAVLAASAGCTAVVDFIGDRLLEEVNVFNETNRRVGGSITVVDPAGDTVLDETFDLAASDDEDGSGSGNESSSEDEQSTAVYDDVWTESGSYEVTVELPDTEIDGQSQASGTVTIDDTDEEMLAVALGSGEVDEPIGFRVGESLSDFAD
ncbi:twin-arginine translocation signal domain-containing protein [Natronoarchaeum mannanilyticum]|uniref:Twin-arginine translocation signal domain-containing protein n=1 Tax=Natronoarchaeum mannanilyticum TaxID=926360 RepID=A0AAV3T7N3_9EURY